MSDNLRMIALDGIRRHAEWLILSSREIGHYLALLKAQPGYETEAEDAMKRAIDAIVEAHSNTIREIDLFRALPTEK